MQNQLLQTTQKMSSYDLLVIINRARAEFGENLVRLNDFNNRVSDELEGDHYEKIVVTNPNGTQSTHYQLSLDQCTLVSMRESKAVRRNVLEKLKAKSTPALPNFNDPVASARAWADAMEQQQLALAEVAELQPKALALDTITHSAGSIGVREAAKAVGMGQNEFVAWCVDISKPVSSRFMYRSEGGDLHAYQHRIEQGYITEKVQSFIGRDGRDRVAPRVKFTPKGIAHIATLLKSAKAVA